MNAKHRQGGAATLWREDPPRDMVTIAWLGQAGFAMRVGDLRLVIDPYLSDALAVKYRGKLFDHQRMMPAPMSPEALQPLDAVLCTHAHSDHMDPGALSILADRNPDALVLVPRAEIQTAIQRGVPGDQLVPISADQTLALCDGLRVTAVAAAHESFKTNEAGEHHYLGYIFNLGELTVYHAGDTVVYDGLAEKLIRYRIDAAMLPVNGRDAYRAEHGVPGNMTFEEAAGLCRAVGIDTLIPHHFGMFAFNTIEPEELRQLIEAMNGPPHVLVPRPDQHLLFTRTAETRA